MRSVDDQDVGETLIDTFPRCPAKWEKKFGGSHKGSATTSAAATTGGSGGGY
ncbi:MAG: hypothetical protein H0A75_07480 [Candidatus Methanofishera endochildressiae]|uniref:Uncharacterized protein n=1 Tax=Candidatus Methanofishera endochildressiae TaxID=2738884 RepID=A0A7Z0SE45_9GAMM|nr:hypothetical protein [Candidatus Methanofishera endochildressiae]